MSRPIGSEKGATTTRNSEDESAAWSQGQNPISLCLGLQEAGSASKRGGACLWEAGSACGRRGLPEPSRRKEQEGGNG